MNKDLDARLIPNGQYRDAQNVSISRSSGDSVGTFQNSLGNIIENDIDLPGSHLEIIGYFVNESFNCIYLFITNYNDVSSSGNNFAPSSSSNYIIEYSQDNGVRRIAQGSFLNFSKTSPISGVDMIENFLFFTDNRNQPRRVNVQKDFNYYVNEDSVSVQKYYPFNSVTFLADEVTSLTIVNGGSGWYNTTPPLPYVPEPQMIENITGDGSGISFSIDSVASVSGAITGVTLLNKGQNYENGDIVTVVLRGGGSGLRLRLNAEQSSTMKNRSSAFLPPAVNGTVNPNPDYDSEWPGDPDFLKERFVRFSYRFVFDENEKSLMAPFSQVAFVPQNDGYFLKNQLDFTTGNYVVSSSSDESLCSQSTVNRLMVNKIDEVGVVLTCPTDMVSWQATVNKLNIKRIELLYREEGQTSIKVVDNISTDELNLISSSTYTYIYQSREPIKVLPDSDTVRVGDKCPVRS